MGEVEWDSDFVVAGLRCASYLTWPVVCFLGLEQPGTTPTYGQVSFTSTPYLLFTSLVPSINSSAMTLGAFVRRILLGGQWPPRL